MSDSELRDIPDDVGYSPFFMLSIAFHILLACLFWIAPDIPHVSQAATSSEHGGPSETALTTQAPLAAAALLSTGSAIASASAGSAKTAALKPGPVIPNTQLPKPVAKHPEPAPSIVKTSRHSKTESGTSSKTKDRASKKLVAEPAKRPLQEKRRLADANKKAKAVVAKRSANAAPIRNAKKETRKQNEDKVKAAEGKRLESMREAELRRISQSIS